MVRSPSEAVLTIHARHRTPSPTPSATPTPACGLSYTYSNTTPIVINDLRIPDPPAEPHIPAFPYPSTIQVPDARQISGVSVRLFGLNHTRPDDLDFLLVGPDGKNAVILSDVGGSSPFAGVDLTLSDLATASLPDEDLITGGFFKPTNIGGGDVFLLAPTPAGGADLSVFNGTSTEGSWSLYTTDDQGLDVGSLAGGWEIIFNVCPDASPTPTPTPTETPTPTFTPTPSPTPFMSTIRLSSDAYEVNEGYTARIGVSATGTQHGSSARVISSNGTAIGGVACTEGIDYISVDQPLGFIPSFFGHFREVLLITCPNALKGTDKTVMITLLAGSNSIVAPPFEAVLTIHAQQGTPTPTPSATPTPVCPLTYSYSNNTPVVINDLSNPQPPQTPPAPAFRYPSPIQVPDAWQISGVSVRLLGLNHTNPDDLDFLLVGPGGENVVIMSDVGGSTPFAGDLTLDDVAAESLPDDDLLTGGFFKPTNIGGGDIFRDAPVPAGGSDLSIFNGTLTDGIWSLYAVDDLGTNVGSLAGGWEITFTVCPAESPTPTPTPSSTPTPFTVSCSPSGQLDSTFGVDGRVTTPVLGALDEANSVAIQSDGKIVAAGRSQEGQHEYFALARYSADGSLDASFGGDGTVATSFLGGDTAAFSVAIQPDGKIVAAGEMSDPANFNRQQFALVRYNANGSRDTSFGGGDGKVTSNLSGSVSDRAQSVVVQPDGKIVVAGRSYENGPSVGVIRYLADGSLDTSFSDDGKVTTPGVDEGNSVALQSDGKIVVAGLHNTGTSDDFALVRYNTDGSLDTSFDGDGIVTTPVLASTDEAKSIAIQADGKIVAAGSSYNGSNRDFAVVRYNTDGSLDTTFDGDGKVTTAVLASWDDGYSVAIQADGRIVMAGASLNGSNYDFALVRYNADGSLDTTFDGDGKLTTPIGNNHDYAFSVAIQPDGRIVAAGSSNLGTIFSGDDFALVRYGEPCRTASVLFDYDADGRTDISVFRPSDATWYLDGSSEGFYAAQFGVGTDRLVPADYDGDGRTDIAVYRPSTGVWYIVNSSTGAVSINVFGVEEDLPAPADYDGDGKADVSVFRPSTGTWYRQNSSDGSFFAVQFGTSGDKPSFGDYDGDGRADVGVYRPSTGTWYILRSSDGEFVGEQFGVETDKIVPADYDGDGKTDIAVYRPSDGIWYIRNSSDGSYTSQAFGLTEDIPAPGDYDGDGKADLTVFRPSNGIWYIANSGNGSFTILPWGVASDIPTPAAFSY